MKLSHLTENEQSLTLPTYFSSEFDEKIDEIIWYNQFEKEARKQLKEELGSILNYISNRSIALSYSNRDKEDLNTTIFKQILGHNVAYKIITDNDSVSICIENIEFDAEQFGLKLPPYIQDSKQHNTTVKKVILLKESELKKMIGESVRTVLKEIRKQRIDETISRSLRMVLKRHLTQV